MKSNNRSENKVLHLNRLRETRKRRSTHAQLLKDTRKATKATETRSCMLCHTKKMCVDKTGLCASCYDTKLTKEERKIADSEAEHKHIHVTVTDDRWT